jgi:hypothetical protein
MLYCVAWGKLLGGKWRKRGRNRKAGKRHPSGKLIQGHSEPDLRVRTSRQPHRRVVRDVDRLRAEAESTLGRYLLCGLLAEIVEQPWPHCPLPRDIDAESARYEAGVMFARDVGAYRGTIAAPRMTLGMGHVLMGEQLPQGEMAEAGLPRFSCRDCAPDPDLTAEECPCIARRQRYTSACEAVAELGRVIGRRALQAVARVAVWDQAMTPQQAIYLVRGLDALARHYGLTRRHRSGYFQNAN